MGWRQNFIYSANWAGKIELVKQKQERTIHKHIKKKLSYEEERSDVKTDVLSYHYHKQCLQKKLCTVYYSILIKHENNCYEVKKKFKNAE